jgi:tRNA1Val (adenine37-N6)-methyltransferase
MPNPYFQFKQFTVFHDKCAMKVTTDGCLFGAWVAQQLAATTVKKALDIGSGSGLLSLMVAQQAKVIIDAVELEPAAAEQAKENVAASPWQDKITVHQTDILDFNGGPYDVIFSNPPFYEAEIAASTKAKNMAHHAEGLRLEDLLRKAASLVTKEGDVFLMLPYKRLHAINKMLQVSNWHVLRQVVVHPTTAHLPFRLLLHVSKQQKFDTKSEALFIKESNGQYATSFIQLLKDYYLYL